MAKKSYGDWIRSNPPLPTKEYQKKHMAQMTAVEWLQEQYDNCPESFLTDDDFNKAKQMQEQQTIDAYKHGQNNEFSHLMVGKLHITGEEYYEQTYKTQAHDKQQS